jgi:polysaccharide biosynthesis/export protein
MRLRSLTTAFAIGFSFVFGAVGVLAAPAAAPAASADAADQTYILGTSDVIEVSVLTHAEFTTRGRIGEDGTVRLPYLGSVMAANKTPSQLSDALSRDLERGGYYAHPIVKVDVISFASRYVTVLGEVTSPGLIPVDRVYRVSEILARVGGVKDTASDYVVYRPIQGVERRLLIKDLATGDTNQDPYVSPGDKIFSPKAELFYVSGQVNAPGAFPLLSDMTIGMAVARAGGVNTQGTLRNLKLTRAGVKMTITDLNAKVAPGDVLTVGESLFAF